LRIEAVLGPARAAHSRLWHSSPMAAITHGIYPYITYRTALQHTWL